MIGEGREDQKDNVADCRYAIPLHWDIAKVYNSFLSA